MRIRPTRNSLRANTFPLWQHTELDGALKSSGGPVRLPLSVKPWAKTREVDMVGEEESEPEDALEPVEGALSREVIGVLARVGGRRTIEDFVSGAQVAATPEEVNATQIFSRRLVEEFGYPKEQIQTRPQFRVRVRPSGGDSYPVDIAVFADMNRRAEDVTIVVECKKPTLTQGRRQLEIYLTMTPAQVGVWFNGSSHLYLRKVVRDDGTIGFESIPIIPKFGQSINDIGRIRRGDLVTPVNLKATFRDIRNHLAGMTLGVTRDEALAREIINILFCKLWDEVDKGPNDFVDFAADIGDTPDRVRERIMEIFERRVKSQYSDVFDAQDAITLDAPSTMYVVGELQNYAISASDREAVGEAFEVFIGPALRGAEGQFFTPRNVVQMMIGFLDPDPDELLIDPACGSGGFLTVALECLWTKLEGIAAERGWEPARLGRTQRDVASRNLRGIDKDSFLAKVTKAYMAILGDGRSSVSCDNSLAEPKYWEPSVASSVQLGGFDIVVTNPPFGQKIVVRGEETLRQYQLAHRWRPDPDGRLEPTAQLLDRQAPQILFVERCLQLLKPGGRMGIVLPESIFGMPKYRYVLEFILRQAEVLAIAAMPEELFQPYTHAKTCLVFLRKRDAPAEDYDILMADARWCGHDSMGNPTVRVHPADGSSSLLDDVPVVADRFSTLIASPSLRRIDHLGFRVRRKGLANQVLVPRYYDPDLESDLNSLRDEHDLVSVRQLIGTGAVSLSTGLEVGKMAYGTGPIPFIRTSDFSNWELKADPKHAVSTLIYTALSVKQDVQAWDILLVRDGTYLVGTSCILTPGDTRILFAGGLYKLRAVPEKLDPFLLLFLLNTPIVKRQFRAKRFTRDIIDTLGKRVEEVMLPIPKGEAERQRLAETMREIVVTRASLRELGRDLVGASDVPAELWDLS